MSQKCFICKKEEKNTIITIILNKKHKRCDWCHNWCCDSCSKNITEVFQSDCRRLLKLADEKFYAKRLCLNCVSKYNSDYNKMLYAKNSDYRFIELVSHRYKGKKRTTGNIFFIETAFYRDKNDAENELKILAKFYNCDIITNVKFYKDVEEEETERGGIYKYTIWACSGNATKKLNSNSI